MIAQTHVAEQELLFGLKLDGLVWRQPFTIHKSAIGGVQVFQLDPFIGDKQPGMFPRYRWVVDHDIAFRGAPDSKLPLIDGQLLLFSIGEL